MKKTQQALLLGAFALCAGVAFGGNPVRVEQNEAYQKAAQVEDAFAQVVEAVKPTVVVITNKQTPKGGPAEWMGNAREMIPEDWFDFFGLQRPSRRRPQEKRRPQPVGKGSGVFIQ